VTGFGYVLLASYWTVLVAELIGDKSIYTVASLSLRLRAGLVFLGMLVAFGGKTLVAVLLGESLAQVPARWTTALSALIFFSTAVFIWFKRPEPVVARPLAAATWPQATLVPFASLFLTEWGDAGQMSAAALTAQSKLPLAVWAGATLALMTKGTFAMALGLKLRERIPEKALRRAAAASCCVLGALALRDAFLLFSAAR
jgi:putative Ca2+/H+ antiporter (TMEM165/GDT1 family)